VSFVTLDFETYYSQQFSLSRITTEEYVRNPQFEVIGVGIKIDDGRCEWVSGDRNEIKARLDQIDWANSALLCHNAMFDGAILSWYFGITPAYYFDTLCMARAKHGVDVSGSLANLVKMYGLGQKGTEVIDAVGKRRQDFSSADLAAYGNYCINDVNLTFKLFNVLLSDFFPQEELDLIDMTLRMYTQPVLEVDDALLVERLEEIKAEKSELLAGLKGVLGVGSEEEVRAKLASNPQFAAVLKELNIPVPMKISPTTGKETYALAKNDEGFIALSEHEDPIIQQLCSVRLGTKSTIEESRIERFIGIGARNRGKIPIPLKYYGAHTGRWAGCLVDDTEVTVYHPQTGVITKRIVDVLSDDLVWDGEAFVPHEGVKFSGFAEVITWDGVTGTEEHVVYTDAGEISLREAMQRNHAIKVARSPEACDVDAAQQYFHDHKTEDSM
jgi:hypothetical protein